MKILRKLKSFILKHRKQSFAFVTILTILLSATIGISAYDSPYQEIPDSPSDYVDYTLYYSRGYGYSYSLPCYDLNVAFQTVNSSYVVQNYYNFALNQPLIYSYDNPSVISQGFVTVNSPLEYYSAKILPTYYYRTASGKTNDFIKYNTEITTNYDHFLYRLYLNADNFWFFPYFSFDNPSRNLFRIDLLDDYYLMNSFDLAITCDFYFMGNANKHSVAFTRLSDGNTFSIYYDDIVSEALEVPYHEVYDINIPIYIERFTVSIARLNTPESDVVPFDVYIPCMSTDEFYAMNYNQNATINNTSTLYDEPSYDLEWIAYGVQGLFNVNLFAGISLGAIFILVFTCSAGVLVLKLIGHLK